MPDSDNVAVSAKIEDPEKVKRLHQRKPKLKQFSGGHDLAEKIKSAGYDISQPTEEDGMLCYPSEEVLAQSLKLETCPPDPRFQQQNVTKWCYRMYIDYQRCARPVSYTHLIIVHQSLN